MNYLTHTQVPGWMDRGKLSGQDVTHREALSRNLALCECISQVTMPVGRESGAHVKKT